MPPVRVALIADIHGNADALRAVLADLDRQGVDRIVVNGDVVNRGPDSAEALGLLLDRDGIPMTEALFVLDWCQQDSFWKSNILSMPKFREKFAALQIKAHQVSNVAQLRPTASDRARGHLDTVAEAERLMGLR